MTILKLMTIILESFSSSKTQSAISFLCGFNKLSPWGLTHFLMCYIEWFCFIFTFKIFPGVLLFTPGSFHDGKRTFILIATLILLSSWGSFVIPEMISLGIHSMWTWLKYVVYGQCTKQPVHVDQILPIMVLLIFTLSLLTPAC